MKHTEEKWKATDVNTIANAKTGKQIAVLTKGGRSQKEVTANARLIAAAPALLDACEDALKKMKPCTEKLEAAIAAAGKE